MDRHPGHPSSFMVLLERGPLTWKLWPMCSSGGERRHSAEPRGWRAGRSSSVRLGRPGEEEQELSGGRQEPCWLESCTPLSVSLLSRMRPMSRGLQKGAWRTPRRALLGRGGVSRPSKERVTWGLSTPTLGHARKGQQGPPGRRPETRDFNLEEWSREEQFPGSGEQVRRASRRLTLATLIQCSSTTALSRAVMCALPRQVVITQLATLLNWVTVALTVHVRCS